MSSVPVVRHGTSTLNRTEWPVIVVPGLLASRLEEVSGGGKIWDPDHWTFMAGLITDSAESLARRFTPEQTPGRVIREPRNRGLRTPELIRRGWGGPAWGFYGRGIQELQRWLQSEGAIVYGFGYDWRESNINSGRLLNEFIQSIRDEQVDGAPRYQFKPIVVTHSNGGLVTRAACVAGGETNIAAVLHTFMPTYGTPEAYTKFKLGEQSGLGYILGRTHEEIACVGGGVQTMGQLLPNQIYPRGDGPWLTWDPRLEAEADPRMAYSLADPYAVYGETTGRLGLVNHAVFNRGAIIIRNGEWVTNTQRRLRYIVNNIREARRFHVDTVRDYAHPYTYLITGTGIDTAVTARQEFHQETVYSVQLPSVGRTERIEGPGDETVSELSGRAFETHPNCRRHLLLSGIAHAAAFNDGLVITGMLLMIRAARRLIPESFYRW
jgi:hypothetical protein